MKKKYSEKRMIRPSVRQSSSEQFRNKRNRQAARENTEKKINKTKYVSCLCKKIPKSNDFSIQRRCLRRHFVGNYQLDSKVGDEKKSHNNLIHQFIINSFTELNQFYLLKRKNKCIE